MTADTGPRRSRSHSSSQGAAEPSSARRITLRFRTAFLDTARGSPAKRAAMTRWRARLRRSSRVRSPFALDNAGRVAQLESHPRGAEQAQQGRQARLLRPRSYAATVAPDVPARAASSRCDSPASIRAASRIPASMRAGGASARGWLGIGAILSDSRVEVGAVIERRSDRAASTRSLRRSRSSRRGHASG